MTNYKFKKEQAPIKERRVSEKRKKRLAVLERVRRQRVSAKSL